MPPLNSARHERFVQGLLEGKSAFQAYQNAGFKEDRGNAARLHADPKIQVRLAELQAEVAKDNKLTVQSLIEELEAARQQASNLKQLSAAVRAIEAKAKVSGLLVQKVEIGGPGDFTGYQESLEGVARWLCDIEAGNYPELNFRFTDDDRGEIVDLLNQIYGVILHRKQEAHNARYAHLMGSYRPRLINGKASQHHR